MPHCPPPGGHPGAACAGKKARGREGGVQGLPHQTHLGNHAPGAPLVPHCPPPCGHRVAACAGNESPGFKDVPKGLLNLVNLGTHAPGSPPVPQCPSTRWAPGSRLCWEGSPWVWMGVFWVCQNQTISKCTHRVPRLCRTVPPPGGHPGMACAGKGAPWVLMGVFSVQHPNRSKKVRTGCPACAALSATPVGTRESLVLGMGPLGQGRT